MSNVMRMRETFLFLVDDQVDPALPPARDRFRFMARNGAEAETGKKFAEFLGGMIIDRKFDELHTEAFRPWWQLRNVVAVNPHLFPQLIHQIDERALAI